jgi:small-conductance mechanosensitive channel
MSDKSLRQEIKDLKDLEERNESPLDPVVYTEEEPVPDVSPALSTRTSTFSSSTARTSTSLASKGYPFMLPLKGEKKLPTDLSCSLYNIFSILYRALLESILFSSLFILPSLIVYSCTEDSWYNFLSRRWNEKYEYFSPVMEFVRITVHVAVIYSTWVFIDAFTRIAPLVIRRSWHLLGQPIPNSVKTTLAGWKAARSPLKLALFCFLALVLTDNFVFGSSKLVSSASELTTSTLSNLSQAWQWAEYLLVALTSLSIIILCQKVLMQLITSSYRKQALASRILASNFKFRVLTRLFRQTNLGEIDARRSIVREHAREALHPFDEDFVEISKDIAGIRLNSAERAESIASALWARVCPFSRDYLVLEDLRPFFTAEDSTEAFAVFDRSGSGIVNSVTWVDSIKEIWSERCNLTSSIRMSDATLGTLEGIINTFLFAGWTLTILSLISKSGYTFLTSILSFVFVFSFLFKDSCERIFKSFIFVLVEHPFDIGDTVIIDKVKYTVLEMKLFQTTFRRHADSTVTYIPNNNLLSKYIYNEERSDLTIESLLVTLPSDTSISILGSLQQKLNTFLNEKFASYTGNIRILPIEVQDGKMNVRIEFKFQDGREIEKDIKISRKASISQQIQNYLNETKIII